MGSGNVSRNMYKLKKSLYLADDEGCDTTLSKQYGYPVQAHHCISCSVMKDLKGGKLAKQAEDAGYDINEKNNGIALPAYFGHQRRGNLQRHRGGHCEDYYKYVEDQLLDIYKIYKGINVCDDEEEKENILSDLKGVEDNIRNKLKQRRLWLYEWGERLYKCDYRDEGAGKLDSGRKREGSAAAGSDWDDEYGSAKIKRRHKKVKGKNKVLKEWYQGYGYPAPNKLGE